MKVNDLAKIPSEEMEKLKKYIEKHNREAAKMIKKASSWEEIQKETKMSDEQIDAAKRSMKRLGQNLFSKKE